MIFPATNLHRIFATNVYSCDESSIDFPSISHVSKVISQKFPKSHIDFPHFWAISHSQGFPGDSQGPGAQALVNISFKADVHVIPPCSVVATKSAWASEGPRHF